MSFCPFLFRQISVLPVTAIDDPLVFAVGSRTLSVSVSNSRFRSLSLEPRLEGRDSPFGDTYTDSCLLYTGGDGMTLRKQYKTDNFGTIMRYSPDMCPPTVNGWGVSLYVFY